MDVKAYLISMGTDAETAEAISSNPQYAAVYEKAAAAAEEGKTALLKAQEVEQSLKTWNETQVVPYVRKADEAVAAERAKNAQMAAYIKTMKEQGYDVPDAWLEGAPTVPTTTTPTPQANAKDYDDLIHKGQLAQMELIDLANEAFDLTGKRISVNSEYNAMKSDARPGENFRQYITRKYDLDGLRTKKAQEAEQARLDAYAAQKIAAKEVEWKQKFGSNPETIIPRASRFDRVSEERKTSGTGVDKEGRPLWQTKAGREVATQQRLQKYEGKIQ